MKEHLTLEQRLWNAWSSNEVERIHGIHQLMMHCNGFAEDYSCLWDHSDECAWGFMWGWVIGWQEMSYAHDSSLFGAELDHDRLTFIAVPELAGVKPAVQAYTEFNELNSGVFEVADDGMSARSAHMCAGTCMIPYCPDDGKLWGEFTIERYATDYIYNKEKQRWEYLHELVCCDTWPAGDFDIGNVGYDAYVKLANTGVAYNEDIYEGNGGPPRSYAHVLFEADKPSTIRPAQKVIHPPKPYKTFGWPNSYLPPEAKKKEIFYKTEKGMWTFDKESCSDEYYTRTAEAGEVATLTVGSGLIAEEYK